MAKRRVSPVGPAMEQGKQGVFLSWSGDQSLQIAEGLDTLIQNVFQDLNPFVSSNNIDAGTNWFGTIASQLASSEFGIICLTPDNPTQPWIQFEAGALAKRITDRARVVPYLHGLSLSALSPPLSLFHGVDADKRGTLKLLRSLNAVRPEPFEQARLDDIFDKWWPDCESKLMTLPPVSRTPSERSERDLLQEILAVVRSNQQSTPGITGSGAKLQEAAALNATSSTNDALRVCSKRPKPLPCDVCVYT